LTASLLPGTIFGVKRGLPFWFVLVFLAIGIGFLVWAAVASNTGALAVGGIMTVWSVVKLIFDPRVRASRL
jgi:hypothetical protein